MGVPVVFQSSRGLGNFRGGFREEFVVLCERFYWASKSLAVLLEWCL